MVDATVRPRKVAEVREISGGIMDITETPDIAVWSKEISNNVHKPSDKVKEPAKLASNTLHAEQNNNLTIDPANKKEVVKAIASSHSLTDESDMA